MFLETIKIQRGVISNLELHNDRMYHVRKEIFALDIREDISILEQIIKIPLSEKVIKARIIYAEKIQGVEWEFYTRRVIKSLRIVEDNEIDYRYKSTDRKRLNDLFGQRGECDDIIIVKNGLLTDSSYSNLAFSDGSKWFTPFNPLLAGTRRMQLIGEGKLAEEELRVQDMKKFQSCSLINALNDLGDIEIRL